MDVLNTESYTVEDVIEHTSTLDKGRKLMFRVSDMLNEHDEPCGSFYYFKDLGNAMRLAAYYESSIIFMGYDATTTFQDEGESHGT